MISIKLLTRLPSHRCRCKDSFNIPRGERYLLTSLRIRIMLSWRKWQSSLEMNCLSQRPTLTQLLCAIFFRMKWTSLSTFGRSVLFSRLESLVSISMRHFSSCSKRQSFWELLASSQLPPMRIWIWSWLTLQSILVLSLCHSLRWNICNRFRTLDLRWVRLSLEFISRPLKCSKHSMLRRCHSKFYK